MEILVSTDQTTETNSSITLWNPNTGTKLLSLKGPLAAPNSLVLLRDEGLLIAEDGKGKPFIHLWQVGSPLVASKRIICPVGQQRLGPMVATPEGNFLVVAIAEKINVWQPATGRVVKVINSAHYRPVSVLKFTDDGTFLVSGGADGIVSVWNFLQLVSSPESKAIYSWAHHTLPVTSMHLGSGGRKSTLFTCSEDRFVKVYSLLSGTMLLSIAFPQPLSSIVTDAAERTLFIGGNDGGIYIFNISTPPRSLEHQITHDEAADGILKKHSTRITTLAISADGRNLASGDASGVILVWDLESKQAIRTITNPSSSGPTTVTAPVTNLSFWINDPELLKGGRDKKPTIVFPDVPKLIENIERVNGEELTSVWNRIEEDFIELTAAGGGSIAEMNELKRNLIKAKEINSKLHKFCVERVLSGQPENKKPKKV